MAAAGTAPPRRERDLLRRARGGDEDAFRGLVEPVRGELHAHCYRMLGSVDDAEDALQDALLRAWRGLAGFEGRASVRAWLYRIATNTCLDLIEGRPRRVLPIDRDPVARPDQDLPEAVMESIWIEPYADELLGLEDGHAAPEARYERRESVELAFIAALQYLLPTQRAALILRDVLGFSAREAADVLGTTVPAVNGALRRARKAVDERLPQRTQQSALRALGDDRIREVVERYVEAWERSDVGAILAMLADDATFSMPPLPVWYSGREAIAGFLTRSGLQVDWRMLPVRANGQLAFGCYGRDRGEDAFTPRSLDVLTLDRDRVIEITAFVTPYTTRPARDRYADEVFGRFGLPARLD